jgi:hypothetical protein
MMESLINPSRQEPTYILAAFKNSYQWQPEYAFAYHKLTIVLTSTGVRSDIIRSEMQSPLLKIVLSYECSYMSYKGSFMTYKPAN